MAKEENMKQKGPEVVSGRVLAQSTAIILTNIMEDAYRKAEHYRAGVAEVPGSAWSCEMCGMAERHLRIAMAGIGEGLARELARLAGKGKGGEE